MTGEFDSFGTPRVHTHLAGRAFSFRGWPTTTRLFPPPRQKPSPRPWARCLNLMTRERAGNFATRVSLLMYTRIRGNNVKVCALNRAVPPHRQHKYFSLIRVISSRARAIFTLFYSSSFLSFLFFQPYFSELSRLRTFHTFATFDPFKLRELGECRSGFG